MPAKSAQKTPYTSLTEIEERYAYGEISKDEYERLKAQATPTSMPCELSRLTLHSGRILGLRTLDLGPLDPWTLDFGLFGLRFTVDKGGCFATFAGL